MAVKYCTHCFENILERKGTGTASLWLQLCNFATSGNGLVEIKLKNKIEEELQVLEELGFVLTHQTLESLIVRVDCLYEDDENFYYCANNYDHNEKV